MIKKAGKLILFLAVCSLATVPVYAQNSDGSGEPKGKNFGTERSRNTQESEDEGNERVKRLDRAREVVGQKCENIDQRVEGRITAFENNKKEHLDRYNSVKDRVTTIIEKLNLLGYDTSQLSIDLQKFDALVVEMATEYQAFIDILRSAQEYECGNSDGSFRDVMQKSQEQLMRVKAKRQEIRKFYSEILRVDIQNLRNQEVTSFEGAINE